MRTTCPSCSASRRKARVRCLAVNVTEGVWHCHHCGESGGLARQGTPSDRQAIAALRAKAESERQLRYRSNRRYVTDLLESGHKVLPGDPVSLYLKRRKLLLDIFPVDLRYAYRLPYCDADAKLVERFPAMLAAVRDPGGTVVAVHRTYLRPDGSRAPVEQPKKLSPTCGPIAGSAIRLAPVRDGTLGVAEGIETALAASLGSRVPVWSTISANGMETFVWPRGLKKLIVFGDNDASGTGQRAANILANRARAANLPATVAIPSAADTDWADVWASQEGA